MNSGKTIEILKVAHNYEEQGKPVVIMTSSLEPRDGFGVVASRIGMRREAVTITDDMDIFAYIENMFKKPYCILIDESQFLSQKNVYDLQQGLLMNWMCLLWPLDSKMIFRTISLKGHVNSCC